MRASRLLLIPAVVIFMTALVVPAGASSPVHYVALGDSYSSGVGAGDYTGGSCRRSSHAYSALWAAEHSPASYRSAACSGATTASVLSGQLSAVTSDTTFVTITIGGNDVGFSTVLKTCLTRSSTECADIVDKGEDIARRLLPARLDRVYDGISSRAPAARVLVLTYPDLYRANGSARCNGMSALAQGKLREGTAVLDKVVAEAAARNGRKLGDARRYFRGHELCTQDSWFTPIDASHLSDAFHPTAEGHLRGYLAEIDAVTRAAH
jgi:lysophospholipase L1-like esterase